DARYIGVVEQRRQKLRRGTTCDDRQYAVVNPKGIEPERSRRQSGITGIDIDLLLAVGLGLALQLRARAAPILCLGPGGTTGIMRHPSSARQRMLIEIVVEGPMHGHRSKLRRISTLHAAATVAE